MLNRIDVQNDPVNWVDPWGLKVINNSNKPSLVKPEDGPWCILPNGQTWNGSPDGVIGSDGQIALSGRWWLPDNDVTVGPDGVPYCSGGLCKLLPEKTWPDTNLFPDWIPPENPDTCEN